jgi:hypothetical protein
LRQKVFHQPPRADIPAAPEVRMNHHDALLLIALICLRNSVTPQELDELTQQLAEFDAVNDALSDDEEGVDYVAGY